ncbi:MAG: prepilin-type N-terminal cleavage/methylation domain-containing protein [Lachnospiraceae bacterium]|nr:prepilin-type N-terminal cleavage/methylation domain-containing protein [Lachnospiraceae bacterium]
MKKDNKGFSYVELLLVLAIIAIMTGIMALSMSLVGRTNVNKGCDNLNNAMNQARTTSMARGRTNGQITISCEGGKYYYYIGKPGTAESNGGKVKFASLPVKVSYVLHSDPGVLESLDEGESISIRYDQSTGAFGMASVGDYVDNIVLSNGDKMATIKCYIPTGKTEIE